MSKQVFAFEPGGPPRVEIQWEGLTLKDVRVTVDGAVVGDFADLEALRRGGTFSLPDGSVLSVQIVRGFLGTELRVLRDCLPLPAGDADPAGGLKSARYLLYTIGALNGLGGAASLAGAEALDKVGIGPLGLVYGLLYGGFGLLADRSRVAVVAAAVLLGGDSLLALLGAFVEGKSPPVLVLVIRVSILVSLVGAFKAVPGQGAAPPVRWVPVRYGALAVLLVIEALLLSMGVVGTFLPKEPQLTIEAAPAGEFQAHRGARASKFTRRQPSPQTPTATQPPAGVEPVTFPSGPLQLAGWYVRPPGAAGERPPGVVYLHGGFALDADDVPAAKPFLDAGLGVLFATLRGENGNPGYFELMYGEVDDAAAAVRWLAARPEIDASRVFAFGHSAGGGVAALLALVPGLPLSSSGSAGGLYHEAVFLGWRDIAPFDVDDARERRTRVLLPHLASMARPHFAYVGKDDGLARLAPLADKAASRLAAPLQVHVIDGDHHSSLANAERLFLRDVIRAAPPRPPAPPRP